MLWWAVGGVGHTSPPGPAWRRIGGQSQLSNGNFAGQLFDAFSRWYVPMQLR